MRFNPEEYTFTYLSNHSIVPDCNTYAQCVRSGLAQYREEVIRAGSSCSFFQSRARVENRIRSQLATIDQVEHDLLAAIANPESSEAVRSIVPLEGETRITLRISEAFLQQTLLPTKLTIYLTNKLNELGRRLGDSGNTLIHLKKCLGAISSQLDVIAMRLQVKQMTLQSSIQTQLTEFGGVLGDPEQKARVIALLNQKDQLIADTMNALNPLNPAFAAIARKVGADIPSPPINPDTIHVELDSILAGTRTPRTTR